MHQHLCACYKSQTLAAIPLFGHTKILHTLIEMGSTALAAAVPYGAYLGKVTQISYKGQQSGGGGLLKNRYYCH